MDPELWWATDRVEQGLARHLCISHCPVLMDCFAKHKPDGGSTAGGYTYTQKGELIKYQPSPARSCALCVPKS